jgi:Ca-activated chloride channel family protein
MLEQALSSFHLLRPAWLIALGPLVLLVALIRRRERADLQWTAAISPHLLKHMLVRPQQRWHISPAYLVAAALFLGIVALAGPSWRRELPPFVEDKSPLMIALDVSATMGETDVAPSRLERAKQKIQDLLTARAGARTGLVAYAGTAHLVMPLTDDRGVIEPFLAALTPGLMPVQGNNPAAGLEAAAHALTNEPFAGTILIVTDDIGSENAASLRQAAAGNAVVVLLVRASGPIAAAGLDTVGLTVDSADIHSLERHIDTRFESAQADKIGARWRDEGFWLLIPIAGLGLLWFRRGVTVQWVLILAAMLHGIPTQAAERPSSFLDLWLTPDQQGRVAFDRDNYHLAARLFADPMWRGIASYRAYDYLAAAEAFQTVNTAEGLFALGNAQAHNHAYEKAIKAYQDVLARQPNSAAAKTNLEIVRAALEAAEKKRREKEKDDATPPDLPSDETKIDDKQKGGKRVLVQPDDLTTPGAAEAWMRQIQTTPADFLKLKFAIQANSLRPNSTQANSPPPQTPGGAK